MRIDEELRLVLPVGEKVFAYHTPINEEVFRANFRILAATKASLWGKGLAYAADVGPQIASLTLVDEGEQLARERLEEGDYGARSLLAELKRLTVILKPTADGWDTLPVDKALDEAEWREIEARVVFFTCLYVLTPIADRTGVAEAVSGILRGRTTSSPISGMNAFLQKWIEDESFEDEGS